MRGKSAGPEMAPPGPTMSVAVQARRALTAVSLGVAALLLAACNQSGGTSGAAPEQSGPFDERITADIEDASANGASADQLALLDRARDEGLATVEIARQARRAYAECAAAAGVEVTFSETTRPDGWVSWVTRVDGSGEANAEQIALACERKEAEWVTRLYSMQPAAEQATTDYLDQQAPVLRSCLEGAGFQPEPKATGMELAILSTRTDDPTMRDAGVQCLQQIGVSGF